MSEFDEVIFNLFILKFMYQYVGVGNEQEYLRYIERFEFLTVKDCFPLNEYCDHDISVFYSWEKSRFEEYEWTYNYIK